MGRARQGDHLSRSINFALFFAALIMRKNTINSMTALPNIRTQSRTKTLVSKEGNLKIKDFEVKLEQHQEEINRNNDIINKLTYSFQTIKEELNKQRAQKLQMISEKNEIAKRLKRTETDLSKARSELQKLIKANTNHQKMRQENQRIKLEMAKQKGDFQKLLQSQKKDSSRKGTTITELDRQNKKLKLQISQKTHSLEESNGKVLQLQAKNNVLLKEIKMLELQVKDFKDLTIKLSQSGKEVNRLSSEKEQMKTQLQAAKRQLRKKEDIEKQLKDQRFRKQQLQRQSDSLKKEVDSLNGDLKALKSEIERQEKIKRQSEIKQLLSLEQQIKQKEANLKDANLKISQLKAKLTGSQNKLQDLQTANKDRDKKMSSFITELQSVDKVVQPSLKCTYCREIVREPVTIIPCGHCFCLGCKKGYSKECSKCGPKVGIEAMYRNQLMDDILKMHSSMLKLKNLLKR